MVTSIRRIVKESMFALLISATVSIFAGFSLQMEIERVLATPFLLALIPPINDMAGNIGSMLGARLSSALHLGLLKPKIGRQKILNDNLNEAMGSGFLSFLAIAVVLVLWGSMRGVANPIKFSLTFIISGLIIIPIVAIVSTILAIVSYVKGLDPDNIVGPLITSIGDVVGVLALLLVSKLLWV